MRTIELHPQVEDLKITDEQRARLDQYLATELTDARSARVRLESAWREFLRQYDAVPKTPIKNTPVENASNIEVPLAAIAVDGIYAQMIDLIYTISQPVTIRHTAKEYIQRAKAMQKWADILIHDIGLRRASEHAIFDTVQLGTGFYYTPFVEQFVKHKSFIIKQRGPQVFSMLPEDVLMWGGTFDDLQKATGVALRFWHSRDKLETYAKNKGWDISACKTAGSKDWMATRRENISRTPQDTKRDDMYEFYDVYVRYDIDDDNNAEDLLVNYDFTALKSTKIRYAPYDERPVDKMCYQIRSHMPYGQGVVEMVSQFQQELTNLHNYQIDNVLLANCRMWASSYGAVKSGTVTIWPGRNLEMADPDQIKELKLAEVYPSLENTQAMIASLAERRTGANELTQPNQNQTFGNRTPGVTAMSLLQQANRRFTPAFDAVRLGTAGAVRQAILRVAERVRAGDMLVEQHLVNILGPDTSAQVIDCLKDPNFDRSIAIELTASSQAINKDADRQNAITLAQTLAPYYEKMFMLTQAVANPMAPPEVRAVAIKICEATSELVDRIIRTFDQFKDPETFIVDPSDEITQIQQQAQLQEEMQLAMMLSGGGQPGMPQAEMAGAGAPAEGGGAPLPSSNGGPPPPSE